MCQAAVRGFFFKAVGARSGTHQGCADGVHDRHACVDVGDELAFALARVRALAQEHDLGLLLNRRGGREDGRRRSTDDLGGRKRAGHFVRERRETRRRRVSGGVGWCESMKTHDHLPVGHLHESRHGIPPGIPVLLVRRSLGSNCADLARWFSNFQLLGAVFACPTEVGCIFRVFLVVLASTDRPALTRLRARATPRGAI